MQVTHVNQLQSQARDFVQELAVSFGAQKKSSTYALARVLAGSYPLPASALEDVEGYYRENVARGIANTINSINEYLVRVDHEGVAELARLFYLAKYNCCFENGILNLGQNYPVVDFFGLSRNLSPEILQVIVEEHVSINRALRGWRYVLQDIRALEEGGK